MGEPAARTTAVEPDATACTGAPPAALAAAGPCTGVDIGLTRVFELLGKRWSGLIIAVLSQQPAHYSELRRGIPGISERMLSDRLTELADAGLVVRRVDEGPPLRVCYRLTEAGEALGPALDELRHWAARHLTDAPRTC
ncbi:winged helix-turn-helix transcriptional regulator [Kitasatospora sp. NPDC052896]|uniref:winged helix-turn-helix transcriptional regulator n=1 Tax=Kitasatospora sp. NPDC052896 TaxID=3364061 RepID=UPI0037CAD361